MTTLQTAQDHVAEMQLIMVQISGNEGQRKDIIDNAESRFGCTKSEVFKMLKDCDDVERDLINQYWKHSRLQAESFRAFQVRNAKPIVYAPTTPIFSHTSHNSEVAKDMEQL